MSKFKDVIYIFSVMLCSWFFFLLFTKVILNCILGLPIFSVKKGAGKCAEWSSHYCGAFGSVQYGMRNYTGSTFFKECGTENFSSRSLSNQQCSAILNSLSDWLSAQAIADLAGNLSVSFTHTGAVVQEYSKSPLFFHRVRTNLFLNFHNVFFNF